MSISIKEFRRVTDPEWDAAWEECDSATYFHSREWAEVWGAYTNGFIQPSPRWALFSDHKTALLPLSRTRSYKGLVSHYLSSPGGTFGGWLCKPDLTLAHKRLLADYLTCRLGNLVWRMNPYETFIDHPCADMREDQTDVLDLTTGIDGLFRRWSKGHRSAVHKAIKQGVKVRTAVALNDWETYFQLYQSSLKRWAEKASSRYEWSFFRTMYNLRSSHAKLWLACFNNVLVAGALCFYSKRHVVYWHGAALEDYFHLRPMNLLLYEAIRDGCERGYRWFDFNPSGGHDGVRAFKKSFATQPLSCPVVAVESPASRLLRRLGSCLRTARIIPPK